MMFLFVIFILIDVNLQCKSVVWIIFESDALGFMYGLC